MVSDFMVFNGENGFVHLQRANAVQNPF
jgi:hypothetical protein